MKTKIEPLLPSNEYDNLVNLTHNLITRSSQFKTILNPSLNKKVGDLVRSMNCYYSNLIEGHDTKLLDIERALNNDYSSDPEKRDLQLEARAHIFVQQAIDNGEYDDIEKLSDVAIKIHKDFYCDLPESLHIVKGDDKEIKFKGGEIRNGYVRVGTHIPPAPEEIQSYLDHFDNRYRSHNINRIKQIYSIPASHHRFCWIHPFFDGNGRVTRLLSHYMLRKYSVGSSLWSISRGLAKSADKYKEKLKQADMTRQGDLDGRGNLSEKALVDFMTYFIEACIDQIGFMTELLDPNNLMERIEKYTNSEIEKGNLKKGSVNILREAFYNEKVSRGKAAELTGYKERSAREVLKTLQDRGLIVSETEKGKGDFSLNIPSYVVAYWFPKLC